MGARLIPSLKTEDAIQALIWTGPITDELKNSWIQRNQQKRKIILLKQAQDGDARAMLEASRKYHYGEDGFKVDHEKSFKWLEKGYRAGDVRAASLLGWHAVDGKYAPFDDQIQNSIKGAMLLGIAANGGSTFAAVKLGYAYADGLHGFPVDKPEAIYWLQKALKNEPFGSIWFRKKAIAKLNELIAASSES